MTRLSDGVVRHLAEVLEQPDVPGDRYRVLAPIGRGGMGSVWLAEDAQLDRRVAVKVMRADLDARAFAARFRREALTVAHLEHPSIVPIHEIGELADGRGFAVMKFVEGETLGHWRERGGVAKRNDALRSFLRLCGAIAFAHDRGVVHRDLKPANVMVGAFDELFVMDWGLAKRLALADEGANVAPSATRESAAAGATGAGAVFGTPGYAAPEQQDGSGAPTTPAADLFALGGILEFLWTGNPPTSGALPVDLPRPLAAIVRKARAPRPADRFPNALALAEDVARFLDREPVTVYRENALERAGRFLDKHRFVVWLVIAYVTLRLLVLFFTSR